MTILYGEVTLWLCVFTTLFFVTCGQFTAKSRHCYITEMGKQTHYLCFSCHLGDQNKSCATDVCCIL
jgi:hypothetical protein